MEIEKAAPERKFIEVDLEWRKVKIYELKKRHVDIIADEIKTGLNMTTLFSRISEFWLPEISDLSKDEFDNCYFSDIEKLEEAFKTINRPFLKYLKRMGISQFLSQTWEIFRDGLTKIPADLLRQDISSSGSTASDSSKQP